MSSNKSLNKQSSFSLLICLPKYPFSFVLSFLTECDGATAALLTNKYLCYNILPLFQRNISDIHVNSNETKSKCKHDNVRRLRKIRHIYIPFKSQEPSTLLARLNTRRLRYRIQAFKKKNAKEVIIDNPIYPLHMSTNEIAEFEWSQSQKNLQNDQNQRFPQHLESKFELLRFPSVTSASTLKSNIKSVQTSKIANAIPNLSELQKQHVFPIDEVTLLASYPRCGNSLLRSLFEKLTCSVTGSDTRPDRTLALALSNQHGMIGEGITNSPICNSSSINSFRAMNSPGEGVHLVKTHFPERRGCRYFDAHRIILLTRNPYDALESYFHMALTNTHTETLTDESFEKFNDTWEDLVKKETKTWRDFYLFWLNEVRKQKSGNGNSRKNSVPLLVVRYEDLISETREVMRRVLAFTMGKPLIHKRGEDGDGIGVFWEHRLDVVLGKNNEEEKLASLGPYQPRSINLDRGESTETIKIGKSLAKNRYPDKLLEHMNQIAGELLRSFGYDVLNQGFPQYLKSIPRRDRVLINVPLSSPIDHKKNCSLQSSGDQIPLHCKPSICVNYGNEIRDSESKYGRYMTTFRKLYTDDDLNPLPTISKGNH